MTHNRESAQAKVFQEKAKLALLRQRRTIKSLALKLGRPRPSVSRAINHGIFPDLREQIAKALKI